MSMTKNEKNKIKFCYGYKKYHVVQKLEYFSTTIIIP
jgi:hypothetical protein